MLAETSMRRNFPTDSENDMAKTFSLPIGRKNMNTHCGGRYAFLCLLHAVAQILYNKLKGLF